MIILFALVVAVLFGTGAFLMLKRDLMRMVVGISLISSAANLFIIAAGLSRGRAPIHPFPTQATISDPLVQALVLTAVVISFGVIVLLLSLVYRIYTTHQSLDQEDLRQVEEEEVAGLEQEREPEAV